MEKAKPTFGYLIYNTEISNTLVHTKVFMQISEQELDCESVIIDSSGTAPVYGTADAINQLKKLKSKDLLMGIIVSDFNDRQPPFYSSDDVKHIRNAVGIEVPIFGFNIDLKTDQMINFDGNVTIVNPSSSLFIEHVRTLRADNEGIKKDLRRKVTAEISAILEAHYINFPDLTVDDNTRLVLGALRWRGRVLPPEIIAEEFDSVLEKQMSLPAVEQNEYDKDIAKLKNLSDEERKEIVGKLEKYKSDPNYYTKCFGFAIDYETLMHDYTYGYGTHSKAAQRVEEALQFAEAIRCGKKSTYNSWNSNYRKSIVRGIIYEPQEGFSTPFLKITELRNQTITPEILRKIADFLYTQKKIIPVSEDLKVI